jgi:hypothetical protein
MHDFVVGLCINRYACGYAVYKLYQLNENITYLSSSHSESSRHQNEKEDRANVEATHHEREGRLKAGS